MSEMTFDDLGRLLDQEIKNLQSRRQAKRPGTPEWNQLIGRIDGLLQVKEWTRSFVTYPSGGE